MVVFYCNLSGDRWAAFPVEVYLVNNSSKTPVTKVELITNEQNESWSLFSFVQICFTNQQPAAGASFSHLWAAAAPDACRPGFPPHTPTDAAGGHRCSVLGAVSRGHWWSVTAGAEDSPAGPYRWQPALRLLPHWSPGNTCKWQNKEPHEKTLTWEMSSFSQFYQRLGVFFFYNYYFLFFCDVTKMLNNETCSLKWKVS